MKPIQRATHRLFFFIALMLLLQACAGATSVAAPPTLPIANPTEPPAADPVRINTRVNASIRFEHFTLEDGLSQSTINTILQDRQGFLWLGTQDGLNRYDGYSFKVYSPDPEKTGSLSDRWITALVEDQDGFIWVGTRQGGLNRFDPQLGLFTVFQNDPLDPASLNDNDVHTLFVDREGFLWVGTEAGLDRFDPAAGNFKHYEPVDRDGLSSRKITAIFEDSAGILWIGTHDGGLNRFDRVTGKFEIFKYDANDSYSLSHNRVTAITEDPNGNLWVGTPNGLNLFDRRSRTFTRYAHVNSEADSLGNNNVMTLYVDDNGTLWVGTNDGLDQYSERLDRFVHYRNEPSNPKSLSHNTVFSIYEDRSGVLWIGTYGGGLNKYNRQQDQFTYYRHDAADPDSLSSNMIFSIHVDPFEIVWIGTFGGGLNRFNPITGVFTKYQYNPEDPNSISSDHVYSIEQERNGGLWIGTSRGLDHLDPKTGIFTHYLPPASKQENGLSTPPVYTIDEDSSGMVWLGTFNGLDQFDPSTGSFVHYAPDASDPLSLAGGQVVAIGEDAGGQLWFGTFENGLHRFDPLDEGFIHYVNRPGDPTSLSNNSVLAIYADQTDTLWIGTAGGGLNRYDPATDSFTAFTEKDGLPNNVVYAIVEDDAGHLWLSTNYGVSRFDPLTNTFRNFTASDGLQSNEFNSGAYAVNSRGEIYLGGINGLNAFDPQQISTDTHVPAVALTSITQDGQPLESDEQPEALREITLQWPQNSFEFEFAALSFNQPHQNQYAYKLENFDSNWNNLGVKRNGRYTNLPGGNYTLLLKASNSDGAWNETPLRINVTVIPPFWETNWFRLLAGLMLAGAIAGGYRLRLRNVQHRTRALEGLVHDRTSALEKRTREVEALYQADEKILRNVSINQVFQTLVDVAVDILKADRGIVFAWDEEETRVVPRVSHGFRAHTLAVMKFVRGEGMVGRVLATGQAVIIPDLQPEDLRPDIRAAILAEGIHSFVHLPIQIDQRVIGVFSVGFTRPGAINDDILRLFTALVQRASLSIANMQLFEQTKDLAVMEERNRLARDLHDSAKQKAFAALAQLGTANGMMRDSSSEVKPHLNEAENLVYEVIQELTFLIQEIYPIALQEKGLPVTLREYVFEWESRNEIAVNLVIHDSYPLELETEQAIYRIIQESLANIARHSRATHVDVSLVYHPDGVEVIIADNGRGFDVNQKVRGMGLRSIRDRVGTIRGSLQIQSEPGQGTRVLIQLPVKSETKRKIL
jgi:ligand-binding sensor domain-containing protein/signal transduction histidine kinase